MKVSERLITKELADAYLRNNPMNRKIKPNLVVKYAAQMERGAWHQNGQPIIVSASGALLDGQHRLSAIVMSGIPQRCMVVEGVDDSAFATIDTGMSRTTADVMGMTGVGNANVAASAARFLWYWDQHGYAASVSAAAKPTHEELIGVVRSDPHLLKSVEFVLGTTGEKKPLIPPGALSFGHTLFSRINIAEAESFTAAFLIGAPIESGTALHRLRERLIADRASRTHLSTRDQLGLLFKAWNFTRRDFRPSNLRIRNKGDRAEAFPIPE